MGHRSVVLGICLMFGLSGQEAAARHHHGKDRVACRLHARHHARVVDAGCRVVTVTGWHSGYHWDRKHGWHDLYHRGRFVPGERNVIAY